MSTKNFFIFFSYKVLTNAHNSSIIILERKESDIMKKEIRQDIIKVLDTLLDDTIRQYGFEAKRTLVVAEKVEKLKQQIATNSIKLF